jgi:hypothetical protein
MTAAGNTRRPCGDDALTAVAFVRAVRSDDRDAINALTPTGADRLVVAELLAEVLLDAINQLAEPDHIPLDEALDRWQAQVVGRRFTDPEWST